MISNLKEEKTKNKLLKEFAGEPYVPTTMYKDFIKIAREEGLNAIAMVFEKTAIAAKKHKKTNKNL
ncbi:MAG: hypothetical protein HQK79_21630 [Desulfobacterales bacterium]|nr:hypothetical protein [Desulfobacterales bacterium]